MIGEPSLAGSPSGLLLDLSKTTCHHLLLLLLLLVCLCEHSNMGCLVYLFPRLLYAHSACALKHCHSLLLQVMMCGTMLAGLRRRGCGGCWYRLASTERGMSSDMKMSSRRQLYPTLPRRWIGYYNSGNDGPPAAP